MLIPEPNPSHPLPRSPGPIVIEQYRFLGFWRHPALCGLELIPCPDGRMVAIVTELCQNPGTSVTNCAEMLASQVCREFGIAPQRLVWIEHYGYGRPDQPRGFDRVTFQTVRSQLPLPPSAASRHLGTLAVFRGARESLFERPRWRPMKEEDWAALGLPPRPSVCYAEEA